jgi:hypothetical protein
MNPRTLFAWLVVALIVATCFFFLYHIVDVAQVPQKDIINGQINSFHENPVAAKNVFHDEPVLSLQHEDHLSFHSEPLQPPTEPPKPMPVVVGQTEEDLRALRQVSETTPAVEYPEPEAKDPLESVVNSESEFGDNLRHPEQTIEIMPPLGSMRVMPSGVGSEEPPSLGGNQSVQYSPEMAQNGGEFMSGIFAFDSSDGGGIGFSMI